MNAGLKALVGLSFDLLKVGQDAVAKKNFFVMLPDIFQAVSDLPAVVATVSGLPAEFEALPSAESQADLSAYVASKLSMVEGSDQLQAVVAAVLKLVQDGVADVSLLVAAIKKKA